MIFSLSILRKSKFFFLHLFSHLWIFADFVNDIRCGYDLPTRRNSTNHRQSADHYRVRPHVIRDLISYMITKLELPD